MENINNMATTLRASHEWARRPMDQRFLSLEGLRNSVAGRKAESWTLATEVKDLRAGVVDGTMTIDAYDMTAGMRRDLMPTNWAFNQLSGYAKAPAWYLRQLPTQLAAINLQWGLENNPLRNNGLVLGHSNGTNSLRAITSLSYGRIWDEQVVDAVMEVNHSGRWKVPAASYSTTNPLRATTLYASDRDVFIFLVDEEHPIDVGDETLFRGFYTWNSEVGSSVFGLSTFLYRYICDNRIIWGATDIQELRIRHTGGAPERFAYEGAQYLERYSNESAAGIVEPIKKAKAFELPNAEKPGDGWEKWLQERGFNVTQSKNAVATAIAEEGEARSLWDIIQGVTANARQIPHTNERVELEAAAGKLMRYAEARA